MSRLQTLLIFFSFCTSSIYASCFIRIFTPDQKETPNFNQISISLFPEFPLWEKTFQSKNSTTLAVSPIFRFSPHTHIFYLFNPSWTEALHISDKSGYANTDKAWFVLVTENIYKTPFSREPAKLKFPWSLSGITFARLLTGIGQYFTPLPQLRCTMPQFPFKKPSSFGSLWNLKSPKE